MGTNVLFGLLRTLVFFACFRYKFIPESKGKVFVMEDGMKFRVFRHVKVGNAGKHHPEAVFKIRFLPENMTVKQNILFSYLPMLIFMGFKGFRSKYWCVNDETGLCQGIYEWDTIKDAENYSKSIAFKVMSARSVPGTVNFEIIDQRKEPYWVMQ